MESLRLKRRRINVHRNNQFTKVARIAGILFVVLSLISGLSGCAAPTKIYAKNTQLGVFFTVPSNWHQIPEEDIRSYEVEGADAASKSKADLVLWQEAYSASKETTAKNILQLEAPKALTAFARVRALTIEESDAMSYNGLRNLILPVTDLITGSSQVVEDFQLLNEEEFITETGRGLRTVFSFTPKGGTNETVHQTALLANDRQSIYFFLVRCTTECFTNGEETANGIIESFTVKGRK